MPISTSSDLIPVNTLKQVQQSIRIITFSALTERVATWLMRETHFIEQNKEKWNEFEQRFVDESDPEKVSNLFIQITDDLSYSRTYYPNRSVKIYLNNLAQKVFQSIYKNRVRRRSKFTFFWKEELPKYLYEARGQLLLAFVLFMISFSIGVFSSMHDPDFARFILGDTYVNMTEKNIETGDPMAVYKEMNQFDMFFGITLNNLIVAFITLMLGVVFGVGTAYLIITNGIMVGVFQYFFIERDLFWESFLTIWVHGALEISAIVIAGGAGFTIGKGFLFPGTFRRMQSFRLNGLRAIQIFIGIAPVIVLAGINESFLTRYTDAPDWIRAILIIVEFAFMLYYFVIYPMRKAKSGFKIKARADEIPADKVPEFNLKKIKTGGEIFSDSFLVLRQFIGPVISIISILTIFYTTVYFLFAENIRDVEHSAGSITNPRDMILFVIRIIPETFRDVFHQIGNANNYVLTLINAIALWILLSLCSFILIQVKNNQLVFNKMQFLSFVFKKSWMFLLLAVLLQLLALNNSVLLKIIYFAIFPLIAIMAMAAGQRNRYGIGIFSSGYFFFKYLGRVTLHYLTLLLLSVALSWIAHSLISFINAELIKMNIPFAEEVYQAITIISITLIFLFIIFLQICMVTVNMGLMYSGLYEISTAASLKEKIASLGKFKNNSFSGR